MVYPGVETAPTLDMAVPDLTGKPKDEAQDALVKLGLIV